MEKLEARHQIQFRFAVPNAHFTTGLVERRMRMVHDFMGKLNMQGTGMSVSEIALMFQYIACRINTIPYGVKNINTYSERKIQGLRNDSELITFISPADWMMFQNPKGIDFKSIQGTRGSAIRSTMDKLDTLEEFRNDEIMKVLNKQYDNVNLESSNCIKLNSVVLVRNIANETKREPLKIARIDEIKESRDNVQRVVILTYHNVSKNKNGKWIGTPMTVERSVKDLILVDDALNESMLSPKVKENKIEIENETQNDEVKEDEKQNAETVNSNEGNNESLEDELNDKIESDKTSDETMQNVRRSNRNRNQRYNIHPDEIGENDDEKDEDYQN